jgi:DUF1680 family protein
LTIDGSGSWSVKIRIPSWTKNAIIAVNGQVQAISAAPGSYATLSRTWSVGDTITVRLPMSFRLVPANDNRNVAAVAFGPVILSGNYGSTSLSSNPTLALGSLTRTSTTALTFRGTANGQSVNIGPFYDAHGHNYVVYWAVSGSLPGS